MLDSALVLLLAHGWEKVTVASVAEHCGRARSTLYRQWPNRLDLLRDVVCEQSRLAHTVPTGELRRDLIAELDAFATALTNGVLGQVLPVVVHMAQTDSEFFQLRRSVQADGTSVLREILERPAIGARSCCHGIDLDIAIASLSGAVLYQYLFDPGSLDYGFVVAVVVRFISNSSPSTSCQVCI